MSKRFGTCIAFPENMAFRAGVSALALVIGTMSVPAFAQAGPDAQAAPAPADIGDQSQTAIEKDIIVTGTLLRGVAPVGTNVIGVSRSDIIATGAANTNDLLASIPQVGNFETVPVGAGNYSNPIVRPNIRNLGASGGSTTLVLLNGHRLVGAGVLQRPRSIPRSSRPMRSSGSRSFRTAAPRSTVRTRSAGSSTSSRASGSTGSESTRVTVSALMKNM